MTTSRTSELVTEAATFRAPSSIGISSPPSIICSTTNRFLRRVASRVALAYLAGCFMPSNTSSGVISWCRKILMRRITVSEFCNALAEPNERIDSDGTVVCVIPEFHPAFAKPEEREKVGHPIPSSHPIIQ